MQDRDQWEVWNREEAHRCGRCGTSEWEWDNGAEPWEADVHLCQGCYRIDRHLGVLNESRASRHGLSVRLFRND